MGILGWFSVFCHEIKYWGSWNTKERELLEIPEWRLLQWADLPKPSQVLLFSLLSFPGGSLGAL